MRHLLTLIKVRITSLVTLTAMAGYGLAPSPEWGWRFIAVARLQYQNLRFQGILPSVGVEPVTGRMDHNLQFSLRLDLPIKSFMAISADYLLLWNKSNASINYGALGLFPVNYTKN